MAKCIRIWPRPNADRSSRHSATRTATIRRMARANEIANTQTVFGTNKLPIRHFLLFVNSSLFRRIFDNCAISDVRAATEKRPPIEKPRRRQARSRSAFRIVSQAWVTFTEQKWVNSRERRGFLTKARGRIEVRRGDVASAEPSRVSRIEHRAMQRDAAWVRKASH